MESSRPFGFRSRPTPRLRCHASLARTAPYVEAAEECVRNLAEMWSISPDSSATPQPSALSPKTLPPLRPIHPLQLRPLRPQRSGAQVDAAMPARLGVGHVRVPAVRAFDQA